MATSVPGSKLCEFFGLDAKEVAKIAIIDEPGNVLRAEITMLVGEDKLLRFLEKYTVEEG